MFGMLLNICHASTQIADFSAVGLIKSPVEVYVYILFIKHRAGRVSETATEVCQLKT